MDKAQELELAVMGRQKFMNAALAEEGNTPIQQFYSHTTIFVTGGGGFLGKHLIEKLLRACNIKKIYVLLRSKKGKSVQERLDFMLKDPVYDSVREKYGDFRSVVEAVEGDISELSLGLSSKDYTTITNESDIIIHMAATVRFDEPLRSATLTNVRGTRECLSLAKACRKLKCFSHVSTAFTHATTSRIDTELKEQFYPTTITPNELLNLAEDFKSTEIDDTENQIINEWPNTYTFTKAVAEELVRLDSGNLPICIVKPPVVLPAYYEPTPGWLDLSVMYGPCGVLVGVGLGVLHVFQVTSFVSLNMVPVDYVNNGILAANWDFCERRKKGSLTDIPLYTISSSKRGITWDFMTSIVRSGEFRRLATPLAVWYSYVIEVTNPLLFWLLTWILHYIPGIMVDIVCKILGIKIKDVPSCHKVYQKIYKMSSVFDYFFRNSWYFSDDNLSDMICRMSGRDRAIFNCDIFTIDYGQLFKVMAIGLRKYCIKDGLKDSDKAYRKQQWLFIANFIFMTLYAYVMYYILYISYSVIKYIVF